MKKIVKNYSTFLQLTSEQFNEAAQKNRVSCLRGCHECCSSGFFDITLLDALHIPESLKKVPAPIRKRVVEGANEQLDILEKKGAFSRKAPLLKTLASIDSISRRSAKMPCPALNDNGACLIYEFRPHICRSLEFPWAYWNVQSTVELRMPTLRWSSESVKPRTLP